ncbi:hypothetical protein SAMN05216196_1011007 [Lutimaribacter pacificus]|uniref:Uncharacterized protein n=2 Tax=Lutimaribacter pacificus TaxID=391948 RepID=A0A1H0CND5_9RHOB|nr:hypothetical protein SAMN05216196_1011007 [Lutimaribacter pacificus]SHJ42643.1 hypothetical protein SAMN05444142_101210 [Lutimaribacter pacificus]
MLAFVVIAGVTGMMASVVSMALVGSVWVAVGIYAGTGFLVLLAVLGRGLVCDALKSPVTKGLMADSAGSGNHTG